MSTALSLMPRKVPGMELVRVGQCLGSEGTTNTTPWSQTLPRHVSCATCGELGE